MTNTYDLFIILPDQSLQIFRIDQHFSFPYIARRWLHIGATIGFKNQRKVVIYGGMGNHALHGDLLLLELFLHEDEEENGVETPQVICSRVQISPSSPSPSPRAGHSAVVWDPQRDGADSSIFIFGGKVANSSSLESLSNEIWHLDCTGCLDTSHTALWRKVRPTGSPPSRRWCHSALRNQDSMIVFGGWTHAEDPQTQDPVNVFLNDLFLFDLVNEAWSEILASGVPPCPRCQAPIMFWNSLVTGSYSQEVPSNESQNSGYLAIYGGAYRSPEEDIDLMPYGSRVIDSDTFHVLDLNSFTWLPMTQSYRSLRGGVNGVLWSEILQCWILSGGMSSEPWSLMPDFKRDIAFIRPRVAVRSLHPHPLFP